MSTASFEDLSREVQQRLLELPEDTWVGPIEGYQCECGANVWTKADDDLGFGPEFDAHFVDTFRCLNCDSTGGWVANCRKDSRFSERIVGSLERVGGSR